MNKKNKKLSRRQVLDSLEVGEKHFIFLGEGDTVQKIFNHNTAIFAKEKQTFNNAGLTQQKAHIIAGDEMMIAVMVTRFAESIYEPLEK